MLWYSVGVNLDLLLADTENRRGCFGGLLQSCWPRAVRDTMRSAESACEALRRMRKHYWLSQVEAAALLGTSAATVQAWEAGRRKPSGAVRMLFRLTEYALKEWPPGPWREAVWGFPLAQIVAWRKHETGQDQSAKVRENFEARFLGSSAAEKQQTLQDCQRLLDWMNSVAAKEREQARNKPNDES